MVDVNDEYVKHRRYFLEEKSGKENDRRMTWMYKKVNKDIREDEERLKEHEKK